MKPLATYRLKFGPAFHFADAAAVAPYLASLGVSHFYLAPVWAARPGSSQGYDVTDPGMINPELGGETGFRAMASVFHERGIGLLLDIVPNHMGDRRRKQPGLARRSRMGPREPFRQLV